MKIITGDEFGLIKLISTQERRVIDQYGTLNSSKSILNIFSDYVIKDNNSEDNESNEDIENLNLFISSLHENYILNWENKRIISSYKNDNDNITLISSTIKFPYNGNKNTIFINGTSDDKLNIVTFNEDNKYIDSSFYVPLENKNAYQKIKLKNISNSIYNSDSVYALYQNSPFVLYNIQEQKIEFKAKNLPNDEFNLVIPMHDTDIVEVKNNPRLNYVSTADGDIRLYDKKASPRPSLSRIVTRSKINKIDITDDSNYLFIGDNMGYCAMLDVRKSFSPCKTFKGNSGSIQTLVNIEQNNNLIVSGFDRYIRWYDYKSGNDDKVFVKNKVNTAILVGLEKNKSEEFGDEEDGEIEDSELIEDEENEEDENEREESEEQENESGNNKESEEKEDEEKEDEEEEEREESEDHENESGNNKESEEKEDEENEDEEEEEREESEDHENESGNNKESEEKEDEENDNEDEEEEEGEEENNDDEGEEVEENNEVNDSEDNKKENNQIKDNSIEEEGEEEEDDEKENDENVENEENNDSNENDESEEKNENPKYNEHKKNEGNNDKEKEDYSKEEQEEYLDNDEEEEEDISEDISEDKENDNEEEGGEEDNDNFLNEEVEEEQDDEEEEEGEEESEKLNKKRKRESNEEEEEEEEENSSSNSNKNKKKKLN